MIKATLSIALLFTLIFNVLSSKVDTLIVNSASMAKGIKTCVVTPDNYYKGPGSYPVLYLLHGYSGNYASWVKDFPEVLDFADRYQMIIVGVDGAYSSWYFDSPVDSSMRYETFVSREMTGFIDKHFRTIASPAGRGISGLSMGGHGALYIAFRHQDVFGACGSMSGGVDIRPFPENWHLQARLGDYASNPENWEKNTVVNQLHLLKNDKLAILIDCGIDDFFIEVNRALHQKLLYRNIAHDYIERPGAHNLIYWENSLRYQALFFHVFFSRKKF